MITLDELRALVEGPALDLPPVYWEQPALVAHPARRSTHHVDARWGLEPWGWPGGEYDRPRVWLCPNGMPVPVIECDGDLRLTLDDAETLARRLLCAVALGREVTR